jgi:hypothetical protein
MTLLRDRSRMALRGALLPLMIFACSHKGESHELFGPTYVDDSGVELTSALPIEIKGEENRILLSVPSSLHPSYSLLKLVDSTNKVSTEFIATVILSNGQTYTFSAHGRLQGTPSHPEQEIHLLPDDSAHLSGSVIHIRLRSTHPAILPRIEWQSWSQGI